MATGVLGQGVLSIWIEGQMVYFLFRWSTVSVEVYDCIKGVLRKECGLKISGQILLHVAW